MITRIAVLLVLIGGIIWFLWQGRNIEQEIEILEPAQLEDTAISSGESSSLVSRSMTPVVVETAKVTTQAATPRTVTTPITVQDVSQEDLDRAPFFIDAHVRVYLYEWDIDASHLVLPEGNISFEVINVGQFSHDFAIEGVQNFGKVRPGEVRVFAAKLGAGDFAFISPRDEDKGHVMVQDFSVVGY